LRSLEEVVMRVDNRNIRFEDLFIPTLQSLGYHSCLRAGLR
jgi:hypothetical protein